MRIFISFFVLLSFASLSFSQCDTTALVIHKNYAVTTDANITGDIARHHSFHNPLCTSKNTLLFYMVGTINYPGSDLLFTKLAANNGYHVISIVYENNTSAKSACFTDNDTTCYENFHKEIIFGTPLSAAVNVDSAHSIYNRILKQLIYLDNTYPSENWGQFLSGNTIDWTKVITAGHSQGSGHAAYLGHIYPVQRVLMFSGPNEYMDNYNRIAPWFATNNITSDANYYSFGNTNDEVSFDDQLQVWNKIGLNNFGDTINVLQNNCPYSNRRMLYTDSLVTGSITPNHNSTMVDNYTPVDGNGVPLYEEVWKYMLGLCPLTTDVEENKNTIEVNIYPNPTKSIINISTENIVDKTNLTITNILGESIFTKNYSSLKNEKIEINNLPSGLYLINITSGKFKKTEKLIIE
jgi:hypothetical protein